MKRLLKKIFPRIDFNYLKSNPLRFIYCCYLTMRFVDAWKIMPALQFYGKFELQIVKNKNSKLLINSRIILEQWLNGNGKTIIRLENGATLEIINDFIIGDGVKLFVSRNGKLLIKGKKDESGSGITANAIVMVLKEIILGYDALIAWDTYITDCDWHNVGDNYPQKKTELHDHVWIGVGAKILKGVNIKRNCIVSSNTVVKQGEYKENSLISGVPGKVVKSNIPYWTRDMKL